MAWDKSMDRLLVTARQSGNSFRDIARALTVIWASSVSAAACATRFDYLATAYKLKRPAKRI